MSIQTSPAILQWEEVPRLKGLPIVGNALKLLREEGPVQAMMKVVDKEGPLVRVDMPLRSIILVASEDYVRELCDETRFRKMLSTPLLNVQDFSGNGLFTSETSDPNWEKAHRLLMPAFGMAAMEGYFEPMLEIADQMLERWERQGYQEEIDVSDDMTRLTLDTIGLCGFDYRFNSFFDKDMHPFVDSMVAALKEAMDRLHRLPFQTSLMVSKRREYEKDIRTMNEIVDAVIAERKQHPELAEKKDLLSLMLNGRDPVTGEGLDDVNIRYQIITFLIAGHETTSGLLSFALYYLLKHPAVCQKAYEEVDRVLGDDRPTFEAIHSLRYTRQILLETLRLWPTAPAFAVTPLEDTTLGGRYRVRVGEQCSILIPSLHRDKAVWGENAAIFDPENFAPEKESQRPPHAYKPFGNGQRACIGRQFAMQEAILALAMILQRYELQDSSSYQLAIQETLTLKPRDFRIRLKKRFKSRTTPAKPVEVLSQPVASVEVVERHDTPLLVLFGSNMGASEALARRVAREGEQAGYSCTLAPLDDYVDNLPREGGVILISSSYNGHPPDNAVKFCAWLETLEPGVLQDVRYAVFGCGNKDWAATFQAIPRFLDENMKAAGASSLLERGEADASDDFYGDVQHWLHGFWPEVHRQFEVEIKSSVSSQPLYSLQKVDSCVETERKQEYGAQWMEVVENRELVDMTAPFARSKRHLEIKLPEGVTYNTGDYLGVFARNPESLVARVCRRFRIREDELVLLKKTGAGIAPLPLDTPMVVGELLATRVELQSVATREHLQRLLPLTPCPPEKARLERWLEGGEESELAYRQEILQPRTSLLQLLESLPSCRLELAAFLELVPVMKPRYYSISSSSRVQPQQCSLTVSVVRAPALSGEGVFEGICSTMLAKLQPGEQISAFVRSPSVPFQPPEDPSTPMLLICAGSGIAPFRGFIQERRELREEEPGQTQLFFGCDHPEVDFLYKEDWTEAEKDGVVEVFPAFSEQKKHGISFVQHRLRAEADRVWALLESGAVIYVCGDGKYMAPAVRSVLVEIYAERKGVTLDEAKMWLRGLERQHLYLADVWSS